MNRLHRAQGVGNDLIQLVAVVNIDVQLAKRGRQIEALVRRHQLRQHVVLTEQGALHQNAVGHLGAVQVFFRLRQHG
ncbi:Uncharacterised protein [Enterobacter cloacae]|nr:Uncharacterised protein [Enterobacter cloacae]